MANKAISELPQALNVNNQDLFVLEQSGIAKKLPAETFITEQGIIDALAAALDGHGGIQSVTLSSVSGRVRTYLITFTDQSATTFQVLDGTTITSIQKTSSSGLIDVYTIYMSDGTTSFFQVRNGQDGSIILDSAFKTALLDCFKNVAWANANSRACYVALATALGEFYPGYTFYDYITLTLNQGVGLGNGNLIITDIALTSEYEISTSLYYTSGTIGGPQCVMGTRDASTTKQFGLFVTANTGKLGYWYGNTDTTTSIMDVQIGTLNTIVVKPVGKSETYPNNAVIVLNGTEYNTGSTATGETWKPWLSFFGYGTSSAYGVSQAYNTDRICETIVKDANGEIIHDLRPAYDDTYYGLLDTVTGSFYYNENNSYYTCGNF